MWDESGTTQAAIQSRIAMGTSRKKRQGHLDDVAASILLQDFLIENEELVRGEENAHGTD
jgi:RNase H-fold protein (predicted Holliday junction resolvase)